VGPRAGLANVEKKYLLTLPGLELRTLGRRARSQLSRPPLKLLLANKFVSVTQESVPGQPDAGMFPAGPDHLQKGEEYYVRFMHCIS
jgi:hypothetical protein